MLVSARTAFAIRCPQCGKIETTSISRFDVRRGQSIKITCSCGRHKLTAGVGPGQVWLQVPCYLCDGMHFLYLKPERFWRSDLQQITCAETDLELGVFGSEEAVASYVRSGGTELDRILEDEAFGEYFDQPEVMYQALNRVHALAEEGNLSCSCGNREISVDIYPERLELSCSVCGSRKTILATNEEDLTALSGKYILVNEDKSGKRGRKK